MYASDVTNRKRAEAIYRNLQLQKEWFASGGTIRILGQKGGNDYAYMTNLMEGCNIDTCGIVIPPIEITSGDGPTSPFLPYMMNVDIEPANQGGASGNPIDYGDVQQGAITLDDGNIPVSTNGTDFYFFGVNCGATNTIWWNSNNAIFFGSRPEGEKGYVLSFSPTGSIKPNDPTLNYTNAINSPCILIGNYERRLTNFSTGSYMTDDFAFTVFKATFDDYYLYLQDAAGNIIQPLTPPPQGIYMIRLIRELSGANRQWVEVTVLQGTPSPGYSSAITTYPTGTADPNGFNIDQNKISPYDISDGTRLLYVCGTTYSSVSPSTGTSFIFQSDSEGRNWQFTDRAHLKAY